VLGVEVEEPPQPDRQTAMIKAAKTLLVAGTFISSPPDLG
jgi:hypothetical protein